MMDAPGESDEIIDPSMKEVIKNDTKLIEWIVHNQQSFF